jgi:hypothetical protein
LSELTGHSLVSRDALVRRERRKCSQHHARDQVSRSHIDLTRWPGERTFAKQMDMQMRHAFPRVGSAVDHYAIAT